jgi:peptide/nickel transport system permease protein
VKFLGQRLRGAWRLITYNTETRIGAFIVIVFVGTALVAAVGGRHVLPYSPTAIDFNERFKGPSLTHPLGTNYIGTDVLSQIIAGAPNDAMVSFFVVAFAFIFGGLFGALAGYLAGWFDELLMRVTDIFFGVPAIVLGIAIAVVLGPSPVNVMLALSIIWWPAYARLSRSEALKLSQANFVESARLSGVSTGRIVLRHIYRIAIPTLLVYATLDVGTVVLAYSGLAYLGLAVRPPNPDWGFMVAQYQNYLFKAPWLALTPAVIIVIVAAGFSLLGDGLREGLQREVGR